MALFDNDLGEKHDEMAQRIWAYFKKKSVELVKAGCTAILDWGFWTAKSRNEARAYYRLHDVQCETHYIDVADSLWSRLIAERNEKTDKNRGKTTSCSRKSTYKTGIRTGTPQGNAHLRGEICRL